MKAMPSRRIRSIGTPILRRTAARPPVEGWWGEPYGPPHSVLCDANAVRARALRARLDLERHSLTTGQRVEVQRRIDPAAVEEVLLAVLGLDEAEAAVGDDLLDGPLRHVTLLFSNMSPGTLGPVREETVATANSPSCGRLTECTSTSVGDAEGRSVPPRAQAPENSPRSPAGGCQSARTSETSAGRGASRSSSRRRWSAGRGPSARHSTEPSGRFRTQPLRPASRARQRTK